MAEDTPVAAPETTPTTDVTPPVADNSAQTGGPDPKKILYQHMKADKMYSKSYDEFQKQFATPDKIVALHKYLTDKGKYDKSSDTFTKQFFPEVAEAQQEALKKKASQPDVPTSSGSTPGAAPSAAGGAPDPASQNYDWAQQQQDAKDSTLDAAAVAAQANNELLASNLKKQQQATDQLGFYLGQDKPPANPVYPMVTDPAIRQKMVDEDNSSINTFQKQLATAQQTYEAAHPGTELHLDQAPELGNIRDYNQEHTAWNEVKLGAKYLTSMASRGTKAVLDAGGHIADLAESPEDKKKLAQLDADEKKNDPNQVDLSNPYGLNPEFLDKGYPDNHIMNAMGQVSYMLPVIGASAVEGGLGAPVMYLQNVGAASDQVKKMKAAGVKFDNHSDELYIQANGVIGYLLGKSVIGRVMGESGDAIINNLSADAVKDLAAKGTAATADDIAGSYLTKTLPFIQKVQQLGVNAIKDYAKIGVDVAGANVAETATKQAVDAMNAKAPFKVDPSEYVTDLTSPFWSGDYKGASPLAILKNIVTSPAGGFSLMGAALQSGALFNSSPYKNVVIDNLQKNNSPENVQAIKQNLKEYGEANGWSDDDIANTMTTVDMLSEVASKVPNTMPKEQYRQAIGLISGRRTLEGILKETQERKQDLDPAIRNQVQPFEKLVSARIDQANDQLQELTSGKKFQYFEHEGFYFKQQPGEEYQEISKERYDLEKTDNDHRPAAQKALVMPEGSTDKKGNPVPPPAPKPDETPTKADISDDDYQKFIDGGHVGKDVIQNIAQKVRDKQTLSEREKAIFADKTEDINKAIIESLKPEKSENTGTNTPAPAKPAEKPAPKPAVEEKPIKATDEPVKSAVEKNYDALKTPEEKENFIKSNTTYNRDAFKSSSDFVSHFEKTRNQIIDKVKAGDRNGALLAGNVADTYIKFHATEDNLKEKYQELLENYGIDEKAIKEPAKPETPEAVKPVKTETNGEVDKEGRQNGRQEGLLTPEKESKAGENTTPAFSNEEEADRHWVQHETDPEALAARYHQLNVGAEHNTDYVEHQIHEYMGASKINASDFQRFGDNNLLKGDPDFKRRWIDTTNGGLPLDTMAQELSNKSSVEVTPQDIVDYITKYRGKEDFQEKAKTPVQRDIEAKYRELTGKDLTDKRAEDAHNKALEAGKGSKLDDAARDIIEAEGITHANIDKLRDQFKGFPYTEEDFNNVKRYLDHEREQEKKAPQRSSGHAPASPGKPVESVGGAEPVKPGTSSKRPGTADKHPTSGLTDEQQRIADEHNKKIDTLQAKINAKIDQIKRKGIELNQRNNIFGDDTVGQNIPQSALFEKKLDFTDDNVKSIMLPLQHDLADLLLQKERLQSERETAIHAATQQINVFDPPTQAVQQAKELQGTVNASPDGEGKVSKGVREKLTDDKKKRFDELRKKIKRNIREDDTESGEAFSTEFNHELYASGIELTSMYFDAGVTKFAEFAGEMITDMGKDIIPYLSSFYEGAKRLPGQKGPFDNTDAVDYYLAKLNEPQDAPRVFIDRVKAEIAAGNKLSILHLEGIAEQAGLKADVRTHLQEYVEQGLMEMARDIVEDPFIAPDKIFSQLVKLYDKQPSLNQRSSTRVLLQQYSTPIPYAYAAGEYVKAINPGYVVDPTAGTGNLSIAFDPIKFVANDIDPLRLQILRNLGGFRHISDDDATEPVDDEHVMPGLMINPPFGPSKTPVKFHDFTFNKLDYIIPLNMLKGMADNGRAAIIIGGHSSYDKGMLMGGDFQFFNYLHHYYNVADVINVDGGLYSKQGTSFPTRLILVNGRKEIPQGWAPVESEVNAEPVKTFEDLHNRIQERINNDENPSVLQSRVDVQPHIGDTTDVPGARELPAERPERPGAVSGTTGDEPGRGGVAGKRAGDTADRGQAGQTGDLFQPDGDSAGDHSQRQLADVPAEIAKYAAGAEEGTIGPERSGEFIPDDRPVRAARATADQLVNNDKIPYSAASRVTSAGSVIPSNMAYETEQNLQDLESLYGPIDTFVANELGYADLDDLANAFFSEQVDALGLAIHQLKQGKAMIIGDMTGIGKGRIAAGLIRYAVQQGKTPFFFTENADLFSDIYRDMHGIGSGHLVPFIINDPSSDRDANVKRDGKIIYKANTIKEKRMFFEQKRLPHGTKVILSTYSQLNSDRQALKRGFVDHMAKDNFVFLDESHNVAGDSNTGIYFRDLLANAKGAGFFSATYAKRADNMPVYAVKTSMSEANMTPEALVEAIQAGGNALQEIVAAQLVKSGQMIRRERDFTGVVNNFKILGQDKDGKMNELGKKHRELADQVIDVCNSIINFETDFIKPELENLQSTLSKKGIKTSSTKSKSLSVGNTPFASKMFNVVTQMLFSIKAPSLAEEAIRELKENNRKPVITFNSTMESFLKNQDFKDGDEVHDVSFSASLQRGLDQTLRYRVELPNGDKYVDYLKLDDLEEAARVAWAAIVKKIKSASTDMSISPIDTIIDILEKEGLSVGEVTGRKMRLKYNEDRTAAVVESIGKKDTSGIIHDFNNGGGGGKADVILFNSAGATGFSMHADKSFKDQRQRVMINGQLKLDINKEIQARGRTDRTNQVVRGEYTYINTAIPAEQRLSMMFAAKLKALQANTTSDQRSKANEIEVTDFLNEYGDRVMTDYLRENPAIYEQLFQGADPAGIDGLKEGENTKPVEGIASRTSGRSALLTVAEQEKFYNEVAQSYNDYLDYLNSTDQNNMAVKSVNLEAKILSRGTFIEGKHTPSPFGQDSVLEKVEANVLRKPLSKEELEEQIAHNLDGMTPNEKSRDLVKQVTEYYDKYLDKMLARYQDSYDERDVKDRKKAAGNPEIYKILQQQNAETQQKNDAFITEYVESEKNKLIFPFSRYSVGSEQVVPSVISATQTSYTKGIFLGFHFKEKEKGNQFAPSNVILKFAVLDGKRTISVALSRQEFMNALAAGRQQMSRSELEQIGNLRNDWEDIVKKIKPRETRHIITGNILQAYGTTKGQLISYTTHDGSMQKGILLPHDYNAQASGKMVSAVGMYQKIQNLKTDEEFTSSDGVFVISKGGQTYYEITVPKSTKQGGKYFKNEKVLELVKYNEFVTYSGQMTAMVDDFKLMDLLKVLDSEFSMRFNSGIEMEGVAGSEEQGESDVVQSRTKTVKNKSQKPDENIPVEYDDGEHHRVEAKFKERVQAEDTLPAGPEGEALPIKKLPDIIADLSKGLNIHIFHARSKRKGSLGSYSPVAGGIKLSNVNNLDTAIHEVGHALDDEYQLYDTIPAAQHGNTLAELQWFADRGGSNPPGTLSPEKKTEYLKHEGIAEFVRAYVVNEEVAAMKAPLFYRHFLDTIPDDVKKVLNTFRTDYLRYINGTTVDRIWANIEEVPKAQQPAYKKFIESIYGNKEGRFHLSFWDNVRTRFTNSMRPFDKGYDYMNMIAGRSSESIYPEENANVLARLFAGVNAKVEGIFSDGLVTGRDEPIIDGRTGQRMNLEWLYNAFDTTSDETLKQDKALSVAYMFAERTIEKSMQFDRPHHISGIAAAGEATDTDAAVQFLTKEFGQQLSREQKIRVLEGARRYQLWADKMMRYMVDKGRMSETTYRQIRENNLSYVAFLPVQENQPGIESYFDNAQALSRIATMGNVKTVIREMTGSTQFKRDPYISLMQNTAAMVKESDRNEVLQAFVEPMVNTMRSIGEGMVNPFANVMMEVSGAEKAQGKPVMTVYLNGQQHHYMFNEDARDIYEYIQGLTKLPKLPGFVTAIPRFIRFTAIHFPVFAARHFVRTTLTRLIITRSGSSFGDFVKDREGEEGLFKLYGGDQTGYYLSNRTDYYKLQQQQMKELSGSGTVMSPVDIAKGAWSSYEKVLKWSDLSNRLAEYRSAYDLAQKPKAEGGLGLDEHNANLYAALQARDLNDWAIAGTWIRYVNFVVPFANVQIQGLKRNLKAVYEGDARARSLFALRLALYTVMPILLMRLMAKLGDYEDEYDNLPAYQRDMFFNFKVHGSDKWISIPKPYDLGLPAAGIDRAMGGMAGHENAWTGFSGSLFQNLAIMKPEMAAGPLATVVEPIANYSFFRGGPIVPRYEEDKLLYLRKNFNHASRLGKGMSLAVSPFYNEGDSVDPRYFDNMMQSMFSYYGETAMNLSDIGSAESRQKFGLKTTGFIKDQQISGDTRVEKLYNLAKDLGMTESKPIKIMGILISQYYNATTPGERSSLHAAIIKVADETYHAWKNADIEKIKLEQRGKPLSFK